jgi:diguanylate cyclase (GGDEF)-like protein
LNPLGDLLAQLGDGVRLGLGAGEFLWREGDAADAVAILREGLLEVTSASADSDDEVVLRLLSPGAVLGEVSCLDRGRRSASIRARSSCVVTLYPAAEFRALVRRCPSLFEALLVQQVETVRRLTLQVTKHHRRAITDQLTQLYNLGFFVDRLGLELDRAEKTGDNLAVIMIDIDHFKRFNDTFGHQAGNDALRQLGQILKGVGRRGDIVARYGGEEFITLLYGATRTEAGAFAECLRSKVEAADFADDAAPSPRRITLSVGVACYPDDASALNQLLLAADENLYAAKQRGRNRVVIGGPG